MSEENKENKEQVSSQPSSSPSKKKPQKKNRIIKWFRELRSELKKVIWPTRKQVFTNTVVSLVIMAVAAVVVWGVDNVGLQIVRAILSLGGR